MIHTIKTLNVWGDSILKGIVQNSSAQETADASDKQYIVLKENSLNLAAQKLDVEVVNHSYFGSTIAKGRQIVEKDLSRGVHCQAAIIEFGGNDCDYKWQEVAAAPLAHHEPRTPLNRFVSELRKITDMLKTAGIRPILMTLPPLVPERYFKTITKNADPDIIRSWLGDIHFLYRWHELYSDEIAKAALRNGCFLIDMRRAFLAERNYYDLICEDGIHPNEAGHQFMHNVFTRTAEEAVRSQDFEAV